MSTELTPFTYEDSQVRTATVAGEPVFVGKDTCDVLGISKYRDALTQLDEDERVSIAVDTPGGPQQMVAVTEPGLYALMLISRSPKVRAFRRWVTHEVIPAIRKTGRYEVSTPARLPSARELAQLVIQEADRADAAEARVVELEPSATAWDELANAKGDDLAVGDAAKILCRDPSIKIGRDRLFRVLRDLGWAYRQGIDQRHRAYQRAIETGWLSELPSSHYHPRTGELVLDPPQIRVTIKGLRELHQHLGGTTQLRLDLGGVA